MEGEKFKLRKLPSEEFISVFFTAESLSCSKTQPSKWSFLKGLRYMIFSITIKKKNVLKWNLSYVMRNVSFTFYFVGVKKLLENALRYETVVVLIFAIMMQEV